MNDSGQSIRAQPTTESALNDKNGAPAGHPKRELTWEEWMELKSRFDENRFLFPCERLLAHVGQTIAWEPDGSAIRESGTDFGEVWDKIKAQGDDPHVYTYEDIPII